MRISDVLRVKGTQVITVTPDTKVRHLLAEHRLPAGRRGQGMANPVLANLSAAAPSGHKLEP
jgi:hypothetical protein